MTTNQILSYALVAGLSVNALLSGLTQEEVDFNLFALLSLALSLLPLHQTHQQTPIGGERLILMLASFFFGAFAFSVYLRIAMPELGSVLLPLLLCIALALFVARKRGWLPGQLPSDQD